MRKQAGTVMIIACVTLCVLTGCKRGQPAAPAPVAASAPSAPQKAYVPPPINTAGLDAGVPLAASADPARWANVVAAHKYVPTPDPFKLHPDEQAFEARQEAERLVNLQGGFSVAFEAQPETLEGPTETYEAQPYRRLAGVLVGDSVLAIIEMGNGRPSEIVRPGQRVPGTEWTVASIDPEKAVLRRGGNKLPHEVVVRLESRPAGVGAPGAPASAVPNAPRPAAGNGQRATPAVGGRRRVGDD